MINKAEAVILQFLFFVARDNTVFKYIDILALK